ncbi:MAG: hypothetical protein ACYDDO_02705 [Acidiferrobacterales bacterium]
MKGQKNGRPVSEQTPLCAGYPVKRRLGVDVSAQQIEHTPISIAPHLAKMMDSSISSCK